MFRQRPRRRVRAALHQPSTESVDALFAQAVEQRSARRAATAAAFRASVEQRLKALEAELGEVKSRLNGLLFLAAGTVLTQLVLHLFHR